MNINLHIERLILDETDIEPHQKKALKAAIEAVLKHQLTHHGVGSTMQSHHNRLSVKGGSISIEKNRKPASLGKQIGNAVYQGIGK